MPPTTSHSVTQLLLAWRQGDATALEQLIPLVYQKLRRLARRYMAGQRPDHTLQATGLINEAYVRLVDCQQVHWKDRAHFFAVSAQMMRRVLVEFARSGRYQKRGGGARKTSLDGGLIAFPQRGQDLLALDDATENSRDWIHRCHSGRTWHRTWTNPGRQIESRTTEENRSGTPCDRSTNHHTAGH
jgi:RNA polymerase sigma factor (TIGR02999 family)